MTSPLPGGAVPAGFKPWRKGAAVCVPEGADTRQTPVERVRSIGFHGNYRPRCNCACHGRRR